ncbi:MAG TPA: Stp1/IreP family PP2C-type Ser/Thr phosphatase [Nitrospiria bacterium]|nr:Stp1/IreP family PP2C-type Ser/Thr phosphatase [Nitrospiria bacterium]
MPITAAAKTDVGRSRASNEDAFGLFADLHFYIVADGMGGHAAGEVASQMAVEVMRDYIASTQNQTDVTLPFDAPPDMPLPAQRLLVAGKLANQKIYQLSRSDSKLTGMGTTMASLIVDGQTAYVTHAGDSRAYLIRSGAIKQITEDHSLVNEYISQGLLSPADAATHPLKHVITRALGSSPKIDMDVKTIPLLPGDLFLLCSDGLSNLATDQEIYSRIADSRNHLGEGCKCLIELAFQKKSDDNITVVLIAYEDRS